MNYKWQRRDSKKESRDKMRVHGRGLKNDYGHSIEKHTKGEDKWKKH